MSGFIKVVSGVFTWCLGLMIVGLVFRINWELFLMGWRALG